MSKAEKWAAKLRQEEDCKKKLLEEKLHKEKMGKSDTKQKKDPKGRQFKNLVNFTFLITDNTSHFSSKFTL